MRLGLLVLALVAAIVLLRRRRSEPVGVVVAWRDGEELTLDRGTPQHGRMVETAERALR